MHHVVTVDQFEHLFDRHVAKEGMPSAARKIGVVDPGDQIDRVLTRRTQIGQQLADRALSQAGDFRVVEVVDHKSFRRAFAAVENVAAIKLKLALGRDLMREQVLNRPDRAVGINRRLPLLGRQVFKRREQLVAFVA